MNNTQLNDLSREILDASIDVHKELGPGLLESIYEICLIKELKSRDIELRNQVILPIIYKGDLIDRSLKLDILVEDEIIIELKAVEELNELHEAQIITYLKLADKRLGFLINFNVPLLKFGFNRFVNNF